MLQGQIDAAEGAPDPELARLLKTAQEALPATVEASLLSGALQLAPARQSPMEGGLRLQQAVLQRRLTQLSQVCYRHAPMHLCHASTHSWSTREAQLPGRSCVSTLLTELLLAGGGAMGTGHATDRGCMPAQCRPHGQLCRRAQQVKGPGSSAGSWGCCRP